MSTAETEEVKQDNEISLAEVIKNQNEVIETLVSQVREVSETATPVTETQPIYWTTPETGSTTPNYILYAGIGLAVWFLLRRK